MRRTSVLGITVHGEIAWEVLPAWAFFQVVGLVAAIAAYSVLIIPTLDNMRNTVIGLLSFGQEQNWIQS